SHGRISDPHVGKNAADSAWVGEKEWAYACQFASPARGGRVARLRFGGLDTLAAVYLNGQHIGRFDNMHREHVVDVGHALAADGETNVLLLVFSSPMRFIRDCPKQPEHAGKISPWKYLRKATNDFHAYLGARPHFVKVGV